MLRAQAEHLPILIIEDGGIEIVSHEPLDTE
jgi:hypothetical protein